MAETMLAVQKAAAGPGLEVREVPRPEPGPDEVLVKVEAASLCGTDLHIWKWDAWSERRIKPPVTLGHEFAGTVVETGERVHSVSVGDFVSAESHITCGVCFQCRTGQAHLCPQTQILGVDRNGAFAEYVAVPEKVIWHNDRSKLPPEVATLQEPFGNAVYATLFQEVTGQSVCVMGCGPVGLFSVGIARASGAAYVYAVDVNEYRLGLARQMGATAVFNAGGLGDDLIQSLVRANEGFGVDIVLEMSGSAPAVTNSFRVVRNGGTVVLFGIPAKPVEIDIAENMIFKNLTVRALNGRKIFDTWYKTRWLLEHGVVDLRPLITRCIRMDEINDALAQLERGEACKLVLVPDGATPLDLPQPPPRPQDPGITGKVVHR